MTATELPVGWVRVRLDELAEVRLGRQRSPKNHAGDHMRPYLRAANVTWGGLDLSDVKEMNFTDDEVATYQLSPGDILLSEASGSADEVGKPAIWRADHAGPMCFQNTLLRVRPAAGVLPEYLHLRLLFEAVTGGFARASRGVGIHHLGAAKMAALEVELPPTSEQTRIVAAVEEQLLQLGRTLAGTAAMTEKLRALRDSLLARFLPVVGESTLTIGELAAVGSGATPLKSEASYYEGGTIPWITSADLNAGIVREARQFITEKALQKTAVKLRPAGTLLVAMYGEGQTRGRCARLDIAATTNQACAAIVQNHDTPVLPDFLHLFLDASYMRMRRLAAGGVQPNLSLGLIRGIAVPVRPVEEQKRLIVETRAALESLDRVREALVVLDSRQEALRRSLLAAGCKGRLIAQDPSDEPADLLVKRIAEERASPAPTARNRRGRTAPSGRATAAATPVEESA